MHSRTDEGSRSFATLGLRFGRMGVSQSRDIVGSTHCTIEVGKPQSCPCEIPMLLTGHKDCETSQVQIKRVKDRVMAQG